MNNRFGLGPYHYIHKTFDGIETSTLDMPVCRVAFDLWTVHKRKLWHGFHNTLRATKWRMWITCCCDSDTDVDLMANHAVENLFAGIRSDMIKLRKRHRRAEFFSFWPDKVALKDFLCKQKNRLVLSVSNALKKMIRQKALNYYLFIHLARESLAVKDSLNGILGAAAKQADATKISITML